MEKLKWTLDYSKWVCGNPINPESSLGVGITMMRNEQGYMCCLGHAAKSIANVPDEKLENWFTPSGVGVHVEGLTKPLRELVFGKVWYDNSEFSEKAFGINDSAETTPMEKIALLHNLSREYNMEMEVINLPSQEEDRHLPVISSIP